MQIISHSNGDLTIGLRADKVVIESRGEVIVDLNSEGQWIRGFEAVGGMLSFSLQKAVAPLLKERSKGVRVAYDEEADAAFFYFCYGRRFSDLSPIERKAAETYSHSVNPSALYGLDQHGGLISVTLATADWVRSVDDLLNFLDYRRGG